MKVFVWRNGRPEAQYGYNDDLIMSFGIGMFLRDTSLKFQQQSMDITRATLSNIKRNVGTPIFSRGNQIVNPYIQQIGGRNEDISWLL
jgi:hypothetical protein